MQTNQVTVNLSLPFESLIEMMRSLELQEKIKLRDLLNQEITASQEQKAHYRTFAHCSIIFCDDTH